MCILIFLQLLESEFFFYFSMSAGLVNVPIVFRGPNGAAAGVAAQHSQCFGAWYSHCPGLKVIVTNSLFNCGSIIITASLSGGDVIGCSSLFRGRCQRFAESCYLES